jgi:choline kinase
MPHTKSKPNRLTGGKMNKSYRGSIVDTAVILAAGTGSRLLPFTKTKPKCLVEVNKKPIIDYVIDALVLNNYKKLIIVTGHCHNELSEYLNSKSLKLDITCIHNEIYDSTNNIYSLNLALEATKEPFTLIESDLVFNPELLGMMKVPDTAALSLYDPTIHNGTVTTLSDDKVIQEFFIKSPHPENRALYKTVNIYTFSGKTAKRLKEKVANYLQNGQHNCFYEHCISDLVKEGNCTLKYVNYDLGWWDEIDSPEDLLRAESMINQETTICAF